MRKSSRYRGAEAENAVAELLLQRGFAILERNYFSRFGELDIVAKRGELLVFVEVKYRASAGFGLPSEAVTASKRKKLLKTAEIFLKERGYGDSPVRFDVAQVFGESMEISLLEDAFQFEGDSWEDFY